MARVNVDQRALSDPRFQTLGQLTGTDRHGALGRMILVWNECQERGTYYLDDATLDGIFERVDSGSVVTRSGLIRGTKTRGWYIKGTKGRVEWLKKRREDGKRGGRPRETLGETLGGDGKQRPANPPAPAPAPALSLSSEVSSGASGGSESGGISMAIRASRELAVAVAGPNGKPDPDRTGPGTRGGGPELVDIRTRKPPRRKTLVTPDYAAKLEDWFSKLWTAYPRSDAKRAAWEQFCRLQPTPELCSTIYAYIRGKLDAGEWNPETAEGKRVIPHFRTVLSQRRWEDAL